MAYSKVPTATFPSYTLDAATTLTVSSISSGTVTTSTTHNLVVGQGFQFSALSGASGVSTNTTYYVVAGSGTTFTFAATRGGTAISATASSGTLTKGSKVSVSIFDMVNLTAAEADAATGDIRSVMEALLSAFFNYNNGLATADKSTKMTVYKSAVTQNAATGAVSESFTVQFTGGYSGTFDVSAE